MTTRDDLTTLCRSCGLCCDGSLFGRVGLAADELAIARKNHLHVIDSGKSFEQPCTALGEDRSCAVYSERPRACHAFICRLYDRHEREGGSLEPRLVAVRRVRELLARIASGLEPAELAELTRRIDEDFARV